MLKKTLLMSAAAALLVLAASCARPPLVPPKPPDALKPASLQRSRISDDLDFRLMADAARRSLDYYEKIPPDTAFALGADRISAQDMAATLRSFLQIIESGSLAPEQKLDRISREFRFYRAAGSGENEKMLMTGYYEPTLSCRVAPDGTFRYPLYRKPDDIVEIDLAQFGEGFPRNRLFGRLEGRKVLPYFTREDIDKKRLLSGKGLEILWCSDLIDVYVLQVQGSGKVDLGNGDVLSVLYDGSNGRPYKSIGKYLIDTGVLTREAVSLQSIRAYLAAHPDKQSDVLNQNQSYVFFRIDTGPPVGNIGVALTPGRSIATDSTLFPKGALAFIASQKPVIENGAIRAWVPFARFVVNQDTGGAIKGTGRVDLFCGEGAEAELTAGNLKQEGELYFLVKKK